MSFVNDVKSEDWRGGESIPIEKVREVVKKLPYSRVPGEGRIGPEMSQAF